MSPWLNIFAFAKGTVSLRRGRRREQTRIKITKLSTRELVLESFFVTTQQPLLVLASNSPRRHQLLALGDWTFNVIVADVDESVRPFGESPADYVLRLAETKARAITAHADQVILAADTTVVDGNDILGKPQDKVEAFAMLTRLRGRTHQVYTGVALLRLSWGAAVRAAEPHRTRSMGGRRLAPYTTVALSLPLPNND